MASLVIGLSLGMAQPVRAVPVHVLPSSSWRARDHPAWYQQALCIHSKEGAWNDNTGNGYYGGMQFRESTWTHAGGGHFAAFDHPGDPSFPFTASPREQLHRAWIVYRRDGNSWVEWGTASACDLRIR